MEALKGNRTYLVAGILATFGTVIASTDWIAFFNDPKAGMIAIGSAVIMTYMRSITNTPPGVK